MREATLLNLVRQNHKNEIGKVVPKSDRVSNSLNVSKRSCHGLRHKGKLDEDDSTISEANFGHDSLYVFFCDVFGAHVCCFFHFQVS